MTFSTFSDSVGVESERTRRPPRRFLGVSGVHLLILATGVLAFIGNLVPLRGGKAPRTQVTVARTDLPPGRRLQFPDLCLTPVDGQESVISRLLSDSEWPDHQGWVVSAPVTAVSLVNKADLRTPPAQPALRAMSSPCEPGRRFGGRLRHRDGGTL